MPQNIVIEFSPQALETHLRAVYEGFDTAHSIEATAWREVLQHIGEGTIEGLSKSAVPAVDNTAFYDALRHSNEVFAAFKVHHMGSQMARLLTDENGQLKPFQQWKNEVAPIATHHTGAWLRTEYNTAIARAHFATHWQQFVADKEQFPYLRWMPSSSQTSQEATI